MSRIQIDLEKKSGAIKPMHAVNNGPIPQRGDQTRGNFDAYRAAKIPFARNHDASFCSTYGGPHTVDISAVFPNFSSDENDPASYDFTLTDGYIRSTLDAGTETFYRLGSRIEHEIKKYGTLPPKDFSKWARVCEHIIRHYNDGWADGFHYDIRYWEIWNEPDLDADDVPPEGHRTWGGTKAQFFDLFEIAAKHLKVCFPGAKIGGPALAGNREWAEDFLREMSRRNVPMDFFSWHRYDTDPARIAELCDLYRGLMDKYGYTGAESILNEWNYVKGWTDEFIYSVQTIGSMKGAAFTSAVMSLCQYKPVDMLMYYDFRPGVFNGAFDLYTMRPRKPYYAFVLWSLLSELGMACGTESDDTEVCAAAAIGEKGRGVLLTRYVGDDNVCAVKSIEVALGADVTKCTAYIVDGERSMTPAELTVENGTVRITMQPHSMVYLEY